MGISQIVKASGRNGFAVSLLATACVLVDAVAATILDPRTRGLTLAAITTS